MDMSSRLKFIGALYAWSAYCSLLEAVALTILRAGLSSYDPSQQVKIFLTYSATLAEKV